MKSIDDVDRRDFLKLAGFSLAAAAASCARAPVDKAIPYLQAPEEIVPGRSYYVASTCHGCPARCGILVKCRDGRPIKIEGNPDHPLSRGGVCAVGQAMVLGIYDSRRIPGPRLSGAASTWPRVDEHVSTKLASAKRVRVVTSTLPSPTLKRTIDAFVSRFEDGRHVVYDVPSASAIADAHAITHGVRAIPHYRFDRAAKVISIDADFLGTWISPVEFTKQWSTRRPELVQYEPRMSVTGTNATKRIVIHPDEVSAVLARLRSEPGTLVVCASSNVDDQIRVNALNQASYGTLLDIGAPSYQRQGSDRDLAQLRADLPSLDAVFLLGCNPSYDFASFDLSRVPLAVTFASHMDETSRHAHVIAPDHHPLESWDDSEPVAGVYSVTQPAIAPLRNTRAAIESFAVWGGAPAKAYDLIKSAYTGDWEKTLNDGYAFNGGQAILPVRTGEIACPPLPPSRPRDLALVLYPTIAMLDGRHAHNAWLHELPDPVTKITWDNYACFSPKTAKRLKIEEGDIVRINDVELPAVIQKGQHDDVVAIPIGYGRIGTDRFAKIGPQWLLGRTYLTPGETVGQRVSHLASQKLTIQNTGRKTQLAKTQLHDETEGRELLTGAPTAANPTLWPAKQQGPHRWAMAIDLAKCTSCSACVIACQAENNVPVVGKDEVVREREMHWIRIDRYYEGEGESLAAVHQPVMCMHCGNAPCETVCPVAATVHSSEGLNQQVYNRCVGTRYCANNCPYKARRFNWFDYPHDDRFANLVLNPDVAVRSRGVMEKCSMCVQRIEEARIVAKQKGLPIRDGAIRMACEQTCPADAIVFGDLNDPKSRISRLRKDQRHFRLLEELNVDPAVGYLRKA